MKRILSKRSIRWALCMALLFVIVPYLFSRLTSSRNKLRVSGDNAERRFVTPQRTIRVACYNIAHGRGVAVSNWEGGTRQDRTRRLDEIVILLQKINADILVLNEVDFDSSWSYSVNQAEYLADGAGFPFRVEERNVDCRFLFWTWRFGNAILSKLPIESADVIDLPGYSVLETALAGKKRAVEAEVRIGSRKVQIVGVHLCHRSGIVRSRSAEVLISRIGSNPDRSIIAGDFNSSPPGFPTSVVDSNGNNAIGLFDAYDRLARFPAMPPDSEEQLTYHSSAPTRIIDWILVPARDTLVLYQVESSTLSDHRLVWADIELSLERSPR